MKIALKKLDDGSLRRIIFDDEADLLDIYQNFPYFLEINISESDLSEEDDILGIEEYIKENSSAYKEGIFIGRFVDLKNITFYFYVSNSDPEHYKISGDKYNFNIKHSKDNDHEKYLSLFTQLFEVNENIGHFKYELPDMWAAWNEMGLDTDKEVTVLFTFYSAKKEPSLNFTELLKKMGFEVDRKSKRTLLIYKGYEIKAEITDRWDIGLLRDKIDQIGVLGEVYETNLEGLYAKAQEA